MNNNVPRQILLDRMDTFFEKHEKVFLWLSLAFGAIISFLMFDCKVSLSGDDCDYIMNAQNFIKHFTYPGSRGALYPIVLSPFLLGGLNLILLKSLSAVFILLSMWLMYKSFQGKIPSFVLMPTLLLVNICPYIFFYASYTYSEPFFMLMQSLFIYLFSKYFFNNDQSFCPEIKKDWSKFVYIGFCILAMGLTRTIGFAVIGAVILYFAFQKQWKNLLYSFAATVLIFFFFNALKTMLWPESGAAYDINNYLAKNFYNPEQGMEDFSGFVNRLVDNSHVYLAGFFYRFLGLRPPVEVPTTDLQTLSAFTYLLFFACITVVFKKHKLLLFTGLYVGVMNIASFILLQTLWAQDRLIMIYYPLMLLFILGSLYYLIKDKFIKITWMYPVLLVVLCIGTGNHLKNKVGKNLPVLQQNLLGNDLYGLTPDWENFIKMSRWVDKHMDKDAIAVSRKPSISYVYTGREFFGIYNVPFVGIQEAVEKYTTDKNDYVFLIIEFESNQQLISDFAPYFQYVFITKPPNGHFTLNNKNISSAIVYRLEKHLFHEGLAKFFDDNNINYTLDYESFVKQYMDDKNLNYQIIDPDVLLEFVKANHLKYFILAKIRIYTTQNTGRFINTIHQYLYYIEVKYPNQFKIIHSIGKEETCELAEYLGK